MAGPDDIAPQRAAAPGNSAGSRRTPALDAVEMSEDPEAHAWEPVIGLEVHVQLRTRTKIFCRCENHFGAEPNAVTCAVCLGYPGTLPVLNREAVDLAVLLAFALGCEVAETSVFSRKNYFYADLPKGYQISQYDKPLASNGKLPLTDHPGSVRIHRIHLEEDAGKLLHETPGGGQLPGQSLVDFNRCGVPLVEIVTEPEIRSAEEAEDYLRTLHRVLLYTQTSDGNMEEGSLRCDANVSVKRRGAEQLGTKAEVKNLNSFRHVARAIEFEVARQIDIIESGGVISQETRTFDPARGVTRSMRGKEEAHDYRYFPEPDLAPLVLTKERIKERRREVPELPWDRRQRFEAVFGLSEEDARLLTSDRVLADYFERAVAGHSSNPKGLANWIMTEVLRLREGGEDPESDLPAASLAQLVAMVDDGRVSGSAAKEVFSALWGSAEGEQPQQVVARLGLLQVRDQAALLEWVLQAINDNPGPVAELRAGKAKVVGFLVGQVMKASAGRADPARAREMVLEQAGAAGEEPEA